MRRISVVMSRPTIESARGTPTATAPAATITPERDVSVDPRVVPVGDERGAVQPGAAAGARRGQLVAGESDEPRHRELGEMVQVLGMHESFDRLERGDRGRDEDCSDDRVAGPSLAPLAAEYERDAEGNRGERVAAVVNQVGKEHDRAGEREHDRLQRSGHAQDGQAGRYGSDAFARTQDRRVDPAVRMAVLPTA